MQKIVIFSKNNCSYCTKAKSLLDKLGLEYEERKFENYNSKEELLEDIGNKKVRTMPQVKIDGVLIGGYNQLVEYFVEKGKVNFKGELL